MQSIWVCPSIFIIINWAFNSGSKSNSNICFLGVHSGPGAEVAIKFGLRKLFTNKVRNLGITKMFYNREQFIKDKVFFVSLFSDEPGQYLLSISILLFHKKQWHIFVTELSWLTVILLWAKWLSTNQTPKRPCPLFRDNAFIHP